MNKYDAVYIRAKEKVKYHVYTLKLCFNRRFQEALRNNADLRGKYEGKRCFIVGCGPSLKEMDLNLIRDEYVFTVNFFIKSPLYQTVRSDFHLMMDPMEFQGDRLSKITGINYPDKKPILFLPLQSIEKIRALKLEEEFNIHYLYCCIAMYERFNLDFDLTKVAVGFPNSVQFCTMIAIYMGFKEIYFIGCDMTGYEQLSVIDGKDVNLHAYDMDDEEKEMIRHTHQTIDNEAFFQGFADTFACFRKLREYAERRGIKLFNATKGGVLNEIERVDYDTLFIHKS